MPTFIIKSKKLFGYTLDKYLYTLTNYQLYLKFSHFFSFIFL